MSDSRIDIIGQNGATGLHYEDKVEAWTQHKEDCECCWCKAAELEGADKDPFSKAGRRKVTVEALRIAFRRIEELLDELDSMT